MTTVIEKLKQLAAEEDAKVKAGYKYTDVEQTYHMGKQNAYETAIRLLEEKKCN